jgi:hypothetical protein
VALAAAAAVAAAAVAPPLAEAHGLVGRTDLPIPSWLFGWGAAIVLAVSFAALGALWREPRLQEPRERRLFRVPVAVDVVLGAVGVAWFAIVVYAGLAGSQTTPENLAPTAIYVVFWVGIPVLSVLFGDFFRLFNPWRAVGTVLELALRRAGWQPRPWPARLGRWPAVLGVLAFAWIELALNPQDRADPSLIATLALVYAGVQLAGIAIYGVERWTDRGDAFGVYFRMFSQLSPWERRDGALHLRPLLSGAPRWEIVPGSVALLAVAIGSTTFDGFSNGPIWASLGPDLTDLFGGGNAGGELASTVGLLACVAAVAGFYRLGIQGMQTVGRDHDARDLTGRFAHSLIPIAFAYLLAHYFSLLMYQGQAMGYLISDPLGHGSDIFGTAGSKIDYSVIGSKTIWYVQVAALVSGHVAGLTLAHDRALALYRRVREATRSQYWMLVVMVGFTSLGLWLLSAIGER